MPKNNDVEPKPDVYNIYSMDIKYIGDADINMEKVEAYRDDPDSLSDFELFTVDFEKEQSEQQTFQHQNFLISTQATKLKVIVTWTKEGDESRKYREEFILKQ